MQIASTMIVFFHDSFSRIFIHQSTKSAQAGMSPITKASTVSAIPQPTTSSSSRVYSTAPVSRKLCRKATMLITSMSTAMIAGKNPAPGPFTSSQNPRSLNPTTAKSAANAASPNAAICREPKFFIAPRLLFRF